MVDVFISYSRAELAAVSRLAQSVEAEGYDVWWDADMPLTAIGKQNGQRLRAAEARYGQ